jgi:hypothetical protein
MRFHSSITCRKRIQEFQKGSCRQAGSFAEQSSVVGKRPADNLIVHDNQGSGVGTAGSILPSFFHFGTVSKQENLLDVAQSSFLLTKRTISRSYLVLPIQRIPIDLVSCMRTPERQGTAQSVLFFTNNITPGKRTKSLSKAMPSVTESRSMST